MTTDRVTAHGQRLVHGDGSPIPARLRIVAWITLSTGLGLLAVVLTIRSALIADAERGSNANITQEIDEFRTFAVEGRDPETGAPFGDGARLLELYLQRQFPGRGEILAGWDLAATEASTAALLQDVDQGFDLADPVATLDQIVGSSEVSGISQDDDDTTFRWGKAEVLDTKGEPAGVFVVMESSEPAQQEVSDIVRLVMFVCLGGLLLTALIAFAVAGAILAPVRAVREAAAGITRTDIGARIEIRGRDDVSALAATFNAMLDRLEASFRAQHRFVRTADAHVRRPLQIVSSDQSDLSQRREAAAEISTTLDDMGVLTASQLPDFAHSAPITLAQVNDRLDRHLRLLLPHQEWLVEASADGEGHLDVDLIETAMSALAHNAAAHQPPSTALRFGTSSTTESVEFWVSDDGPGLDPEQALHLLDRFTELHDAANDPGHDAGLGLAVVRAVADAHEGEAWVETAPGHGARFGLRLPRDRAESQKVRES